LLKSVIICYETKNYAETFPTMLLRLRANVKEDLKAFVTEMVYGTKLKLSGEFLISEEIETNRRIESRNEDKTKFN
jgi:hypothetical protein